MKKRMINNSDKMLSQYNTQDYLQMIRPKAVTFHSINKGPFLMIVDTKLIDLNLCSYSNPYGTQI